MSVGSIVWIKGERAGEAIDLVEASYLIGRSRRCDICLERSNDVSARHLSLEQAGEDVRMINLSTRQQVTFLCGRSLESGEAVILKSGDEVRLGGSTVFRFISGSTMDQSVSDPDKTQIPSLLAGAPTILDACGEGSQLSPEVSPQEVRVVVSRAVAAAPAQSASDGKKALAQTQIIQTMLASAEEMVELIRKKASERRFRLIVKMFCAGVVFVAFSVIYVLFVKTAPEKVLTWPRDANGRPDTGRVVLDSPLGPRMIGLEYPMHSSAAVVAETNNEYRVSVVSRLGKNRDVPFRSILSLERSPQSLRESRDETFARWRIEREEKDGWNFQSISPREFIGFEHGIPYINAQYLRTVKTKDESMQYFGYLLFARFADYIVTVSREIPAEERWRGTGILSVNAGLLTSQTLWRSHWEGSSSVRHASPELLLVEAESVLASKSTQRWGEAEFLLRSVLVQSYGKNKDVFEKAHARWENLREQQEKEFARMHSNFMEVSVMRDKTSAKAVIAEALKVFSSPDDRRNALLKKGRWK